MKNMLSLAFKQLGFAAILTLTAGSASAQTNLKLWYKQPAQKWTDALPIGNGRLGAMIFGGADEDRIQFNEQTLWTGGPRHYEREGAVKYLQPIRQLLFDGKQPEAEALAQQHFMGMKSNEANYAADSAAWLKKVSSAIAPAAAGFNDSQWKTITFPAANGWETIPGFEGLDGAVWLRTTIDVPANMTGKNMILNIGRVRDMDFTYVNCKLIGSSANTNSRKYTIPAGLLHVGKNTIAVQVINFFDKGGLTTVKEKFAVYPEGEKPENGILLKSQWKYWVQNENPPSYPRYNADYQPFADVYLQFPKQTVADYKRDLDISNATAHVTYKANGITYTREYLSSAPDQVIAIHLTASKPGSITLKALLKSLHKNYITRKIDDHTLALSLKIHDGVLKGESYLHVQHKGGRVSVTANNISVTDATEATFYLAAATNFKNYHDVSGDAGAICKKQIAAIANKSYAAVKTAHVKDYQKYFNTFSIDLGKGSNADLPTDERILKFGETPDPEFVTLYAQYGRYLLISSSRPGNGPATLQGLWNDLLTPPWGSKYTTNINLQMNYWPAEVLNLSACSQPFLSIVDDLVQTGRQTAKAHYGAPGWVLHHNTDQWRGTAPVNASNHGIWVSGGAWLCHQLWEHYLYSQDEDFLKNHAYPEMKGAAEFFVHFLVKDPKTGYLISAPSNSPEHGGLVVGPTMDHQIIRDLFKNCIKASEILGIDKTFADTLRTTYNKIAPNKVGKYGQLQEWMEDKDDTADTHRHVSHMWGVFPGTDITWDTPGLMKAAEKSMQYRGDEGTGWSIAWKVNIWARMREGDHAYMMFRKLLSPADVTSGKEKGGVYHNLFDAHPPFQIDGNFGGAAGLAEMLLQSQGNDIELLPALPSALAEGNIKGICARGGFELNFTWQNGKLQSVEVLSKTGGVCHLRYQDKTTSLNTQQGKTYRFSADLKQL
ncbi:glycoside hydrolase family 95 protein [Mucilaginibacter sabulilitoris]|uniref:Glycoside hydrolase family 95 protein n=1 Tax=Mucilaginibacter sabulilitoris TaxID=1173583 RepID=A0ABZ0TJM0_9SPHI|nr:glycoside hydrolase family 95 protein [Mucilaginibacter sabulilitoris]WPU92393.1 glycoside hydrolase family 95 protein [Mucilaginibacter sabulilitoris]